MASGNDMKSANQTYGGFITMLKWGSALTAIVTLVVVLLVA